jgi:hypothetical protein
MTTEQNKSPPACQEASLSIDWDDPQARFRLIERVGVAEYNRLHDEYREKSVVSTVNGHKIRPVQTRFGTLYHVGTTDRAFTNLKEAETFAQGQL